jgi:hypothetical protein
VVSVEQGLRGSVERSSFAQHEYHGGSRRQNEIGQLLRKPGGDAVEQVLGFHGIPYLFLTQIGLDQAWDGLPCSSLSAWMTRR